MRAAGDDVLFAAAGPCPRAGSVGAGCAAWSQGYQSGAFGVGPHNLTFTSTGVFGYFDARNTHIPDRASKGS